MGQLDLDLARAARAEKRSEPNVIVFGGKNFTVPAELPVEVGEAFGHVNSVTGLWLFAKAMVGDQWETFRALGPTVDDIQVLADGLAELYGFASPGESRASSASSASNGKPSKPTSRGTTASSSPKRSGVKSPSA